METCKGYAKTRIDGDTILETLWAVLPGGQILQSIETERTIHFIKGRKFVIAPSLPSDADFIGNYPLPKH